MTEDRIREIKAQLEALSKELREASNGRESRRRTELYIASQEAGVAAVRLDYALVPGAEREYTD